MDIHTPNAAGSSNTMVANLDNRSAMELITEKDKVEAELKALGEVLDSVSTSLVYASINGFAARRQHDHELDHI